MDEKDMQGARPSLRPIASAAGWYDELRDEGLREESRNEGFVWTIDMGGTATLKLIGFAGVDYTLRLNCSHVGPSMFGVYRGSLSMDVKGDIGGVKLMMALLGLRSDEDVSGWFRNDAFVMKIKPYSKEDEESFFESFDRTSDERAQNAPEPTGDPVKDAAAQAAYEAANGLVDAITGMIGSEQQTETLRPYEGKKPMGLWYDWDFHMTEGDMGMYLKLNGGNGLFFASGKGEVGASGKSNEGSMRVTSFLGQRFEDRYDEPIDSPFPYTVRLYPDASVLFTLYNAKGGGVSVAWAGRVTSIPVEQTQLVR